MKLELKLVVNEPDWSDVNEPDWSDVNEPDWSDVNEPDWTMNVYTGQIKTVMSFMKCII